MKSIAKLILLIVATVIVHPSEGAKSWQKSINRYGCQTAFKSGYEDARNKIRSAARKYQRQCEAQKGEFSLSFSNGFCTPANPNGLFCTSECLVWGKAICKAARILESTQHKEIEGNNDGFLEPGEKHAVEVSIRNVSDEATLGVSGLVSVTQGQNDIELTSDRLRFGNIEAGQTATDTVEFTVKKNATCGGMINLHFNVEGFDSERKFSKRLRIGALGGEALTKGEKELNIPIGHQQTNIPIDIPGEFDELYKVRLKYTATAKQPANLQVWLSSPDRVVKWANQKPPADPVIFDHNMTPLYKGAKASGRWFLSARINGANEAAFTSYQLSVVPKQYTCK